MHNHDNGNGNWDKYQYMTPAAGQTNTPTSTFKLHDGSNRGCLDPSATNLAFNSWSFNHGGGGSCGAGLTDGSTVIIPVVNAVCKNGPCNTSDMTQPYDTTPPTIGNCQNGGYCVHMVGWIEVYIVRDLTNGKLVQGYVTKVIYDPYCIVQAAPGQHPVPPSCPASS
jgi:hypothetical protein